MPRTSLPYWALRVHKSYALAQRTTGSPRWKDVEWWDVITRDGLIFIDKNDKVQTRLKMSFKSSGLTGMTKMLIADELKSGSSPLKSTIARSPYVHLPWGPYHGLNRTLCHDHTFWEQAGAVAPFRSWKMGRNPRSLSVTAQY